MIEFEGVTPILPVRDLEASVAYYVNVLGFKVDWQDPGIIASVGRDRCHLFLVEGDQGHPGTWVWIGVSDAGALHEDYVARGATIRHPPTNFSWAYELQVEDPDGNVLRFASEPKSDQPTGNWRDMRGDVWTLEAGGKWRRTEIT